MTAVGILTIITLGTMVGSASTLTPSSKNLRVDSADRDNTKILGIENGAVSQCGSSVMVQSGINQTACEQFQEANASIYNASASLNTTATEIDNADNYNSETHSQAVSDLQTLDSKMEQLDQAFNNIKSSVFDGGSNPVREFLIIRHFSEQHQAADSVATVSINNYNSAISTKRTKAISKTRFYLASTIGAGILLGSLLGGIIPVREARNVAEQMKLSRNVTYNRRAGLAPFIAGLILIIVGVGLLWFLGAADSIGVLL